MSNHQQLALIKSTDKHNKISSSTTDIKLGMGDKKLLK